MNHPPPNSPPKAASKIIGIDTVIERVGLSRRSIYDAMAHGDFPRPVQLTARRVGWLEDEIESWIAGRIEDRDRQRAARTAA